MERIQTVVIGGGQAGLSVGYHLQRRGLPFVILDANERIGDAWRKRWDSLRLFTPAQYAGLAGWGPPPARGEFPTKDEMASYLEAYAERLSLPVRTGVRVDGLTRDGDRLVVTAGERRLEADQVVVAMSNYQSPRVPAFARELDPRIVQLHSLEYKNPEQLRDGGVLVVGVGNSGADIVMEVVRTHATWLAGQENGRIPWRIESIGARFVFTRMLRFIGHHVLTVGTPIGRRMRPRMLLRTSPLVRVKPQDLTVAGIQRVDRVVGARDGLPILADGRVLDTANIIWCTGFAKPFPWIRLPIFGDDGEPVHDRGIATSEPGLYFVGLHFLYSMSSATIVGVGRDAERVVKAIATRVSSRTPALRSGTVSDESRTIAVG